ncbi:unnamed protein product [Moneuplotes crassus]|uniref:Uncharacterized protein n=1 Tax=Euplotes crassus TaxID=5936 RepID=A0AAD1X4T4_EUPCR|nr:unnamed protein product [Moneuplotes crassus]
MNFEEKLKKIDSQLAEINDTSRTKDIEKIRKLVSERQVKGPTISGKHTISNAVKQNAIEISSIAPSIRSDSKRRGDKIQELRKKRKTKEKAKLKEEKHQGNDNSKEKLRDVFNSRNKWSTKPIDEHKDLQIQLENISELTPKVLEPKEETKDDVNMNWINVNSINKKYQKSAYTLTEHQESSISELTFQDPTRTNNNPSNPSHPHQNTLVHQTDVNIPNSTPSDPNPQEILQNSKNKF